MWPAILKLSSGTSPPRSFRRCSNPEQPIAGRRVGCYAGLMVRRILFSLVAALAISAASAQDASKPASAVPNQAELEKRFKELLTDCVFDGHWCMLNDGKLGEEKSEKYSIQGVTKSGQDVWLIYAKMQYRGKEVSVPVPVKVKGAGNYPVITLDKVSIRRLGNDY